MREHRVMDKDPPHANDHLKSAESRAQGLQAAGFGGAGHEQRDKGPADEPVDQGKDDDAGTRRIVVERQPESKDGRRYAQAGHGEHVEMADSIRQIRRKDATGNGRGTRSSVRKMYGWESKTKERKASLGRTLDDVLGDGNQIQGQRRRNPCVGGHAGNIVERCPESPPGVHTSSAIRQPPKNPPVVKEEAPTSPERTPLCTARNAFP